MNIFAQQFRIYDQKLEKMICFGLSDIDRARYMMRNDAYFIWRPGDNTTIELNSNMDVMRCTGLKDFKGQWIFEGDILDKAFEVEYDAESAIFYASLPGARMFYFSELRNSIGELPKITGNIYDKKRTKRQPGKKPKNKRAAGPVPKRGRQKRL